MDERFKRRSIIKIQKTIFYILMFLPLPVTLISLVFLPDQIPAHYGLYYQVTRWGRKYETLIFPLMNLILGLFMLGISKYSANIFLFYLSLYTPSLRAWSTPLIRSIETACAMQGMDSPCPDDTVDNNAPVATSKILLSLPVCNS